MSKYVGQLLDGVHLGVTDGSIRGRGGRIAKGPAKVDGGTDGCIGRGELGHWTIMREELHSTGDTFGSGFSGVYAVASVMFRCSADIPSVYTVNRPCAAAVGCFVDEDLRSGRCEGGFVIIEGSVELCFSGESWVYA